MAETQVPIFNERAARKLRSADDLDDYVRVTSPSVWVVLAAVIALLAGLVAWAVFGAVTTSVSTTGVVISIDGLDVPDSGGAGSTSDDTASDAATPGSLQLDDETAQLLAEHGNKIAMCFLSAKDVVNVDPGDAADVGGVSMTVYRVAPIPAAPDEWGDVLGSEYLVKSMFDDDWAYPVWLVGDASQLPEGVPVSVVITAERIPPISLVLKNRG